MWKLFNQNSFSFSAEKKRKLVNYIWADARVGCEEILNEVYEENNCQEKPAKIYLKTSNLKLEDIAGRVGWGSTRYFIRIFKQYEGITPGQYRGTV